MYAHVIIDISINRSDMNLIFHRKQIFIAAGTRDFASSVGNIHYNENERSQILTSGIVQPLFELGLTVFSQWVLPVSYKKYWLQWNSDRSWTPTHSLRTPSQVTWRFDVRPRCICRQLHHLWIIRPRHFSRGKSLIKHPWKSL